MKGTDFRLREEVADQIRALKGMKEMAAAYGFDISQPAKNAKELYSGCISDIWQQSDTERRGYERGTYLHIP